MSTVTKNIDVDNINRDFFNKEIWDKIKIYLNGKIKGQIRPYHIKFAKKLYKDTGHVVYPKPVRTYAGEWRRKQGGNLFYVYDSKGDKLVCKTAFMEMLKTEKSLKLKENEIKIEDTKGENT